MPRISTRNSNGATATSAMEAGARRRFEREVCVGGWRSLVAGCRVPGAGCREQHRAVSLLALRPPTAPTPIASRLRRRPSPAPGVSNSQAPSDVPGGARPSVPTPRCIGRAASANTRRSRRSHAAEAAAAGDRVAAPAARSAGDRRKAGRRARDRGRAGAEGDSRAARVAPMRQAASRRCRPRPRSVRWCAATSVDSFAGPLYMQQKWALP